MNAIREPQRLLSCGPPRPFLLHGQPESHSDGSDSPRRRGVVAPLPRPLRTPPARALPLLPAPDAQPLGRRRSGPGCALPRVRQAGVDERAAHESPRVALPRRVEPLDRPGPRDAARGRSGAERASSAEPRAVREAAGTLLSRLSPQERAAVVLKEAGGARRILR